jgi:NAD+ diphosphatase
MKGTGTAAGAAAEWHPRTRLPDELTDISIAYEMIEALRL